MILPNVVGLRRQVVPRLKIKFGSLSDISQQKRNLSLGNQSRRWMVWPGWHALQALLQPQTAREAKSVQREAMARMRLFAHFSKVVAKIIVPQTDRQQQDAAALQACARECYDLLVKRAVNAHAIPGGKGGALVPSFSLFNHHCEYNSVIKVRLGLKFVAGTPSEFAACISVTLSDRGSK